MKIWFVRHLAWTVGLLMVCLFISTARAQDFALTSSVIAGGGGLSTNATYAVAGTIGQPGGSVTMASGNYSVASGFWQTITLIQSPDAPVLLFARNGSQCTLHWDATRTGFILESTTSLRPPVIWQPVENVANNQTALPAMSGSRFFRLRRAQ